MVNHQPIVLKMLFAILLCVTPYGHCAPPKLTVVIIIDQGAYHYIEKLRPHFRHGLKFLLNHGVNYENAHHPHAIPETAPGHSSISTGVLPKDHGISGNSWFDQEGTKIHPEDDPSPEAAVLTNGKKEKFGKSPHYTMVDGISDQFSMRSTKTEKNFIFALSLKERAAIATANRCGKALWFDDMTGNFTSSKKYFNTLPAWIKQFNKAQNLNTLTSVAWQTMYPESSTAYNFPYIKNYEYAALKSNLVPSLSIPIDHSSPSPFDLYIRTPHASKLLFDCAQACLKHNLPKRSRDKMLLWVSLSNLDYLTHFYGPDSLEAIDMLYHIDQQIQDFMTYAQRTVGTNNVLFVLTADHGIQPIQEISYKKGITTARRIMAKPLIQAMNQRIKEDYDIDNIVTHFESTYFTLDKQVFNKLDRQIRQAILSDLKNHLLNEPGIKKVWTYKELKQAQFKSDDLENFYKNSLYEGRFGDLICMPQPYCLITNYPTGCSHNTPYDYDTHVPLILYQHGRFHHRTIREKVWISQLAPTLAAILKVPRPSASTFNLLPGIFKGQKALSGNQK